MPPRSERQEPMRQEEGCKRQGSTGTSAWPTGPACGRLEKQQELGEDTRGTRGEEEATSGTSGPRAAGRREQRWAGPEVGAVPPGRGRQREREVRATLRSWH
jgi:hypothetical protein